MIKGKGVLQGLSAVELVVWLAIIQPREMLLRAPVTKDLLNSIQELVKHGLKWLLTQLVIRWHDVLISW